MAFIDEMEAIAVVLRKAGYTVATPVKEEPSTNWDSLSETEPFAFKKSYIHGHLAMIKQLNLATEPFETSNLRGNFILN